MKFSHNMKSDMLVAHSSLTLCYPMDCCLPDSSVHGILQARIPDWLAVSFSRASSKYRDRTSVSCISCTGRRILYHLEALTWCNTLFKNFGLLILQVHSNIVWYNYFFNMLFLSLLFCFFLLFWIWSLSYNASVSTCTDGSIIILFYLIFFQS